MRQVSSSSSSEDNITRSSDRRPGDGALEEAAAGASDGDKRDILDLLKLSYIVVRTGIGTGQIMGWGNKAIEIRSVESGHLDGVFMHKKAQKLKFLCERNDKVFFSSAKGGSSCQIYFMTLNKPGMANW